MFFLSHDNFHKQALQLKATTSANKVWNANKVFRLLIKCSWSFYGKVCIVVVEIWQLLGVGCRMAILTSFTYFGKLQTRTRDVVTNATLWSKDWCQKVEPCMQLHLISSST
jgi:hypothetical protein